MLTAVGSGPLMGLCSQQGGSLSLDSMCVMCVCLCGFVCVYACVRVCLYLRVCPHKCVHVQRHSVSVYGEGMETESL